MITLCVPTIDRPEFVERLLRYYAAVELPYELIIGDSSATAAAARNRRAVERFAERLRIRYQACEGMSACEAIEAMTARIATDFCAFIADDDFFCVDGLEASRRFLAEHPDYSAAHGTALLLQVEGGSLYGRIGNIHAYPQTVLNASTGAGRLREFFGTSLYALLYSVHRTETWRAMFRGLGALKGMRNRNMFKDELIPTCVSVVRGKVKVVDGLFLVRQAHDQRMPFPHPFDILTDPDWHPSYRIFVERIARELVEQDHLSMDEAGAVIREVFWPFLATLVTGARQHEQRVATARPPTVRRWLARIPGARSVVQRVRARTQRWSPRLSVERLLDPASSDARAFHPIVDILTNPPSPSCADDSPAGERLAAPAVAAGQGA